MLVLHIAAILSGGILLLGKAEEIGKWPAFDFSSAPPRNVFLKDINSKLHSARPPLKIVNGQTATRGQFCYQVFLQFTDGRSTWSCGGSLVTPRLVLTAAHCVQGAKSVVVVFGGLDLSLRYEPGRVVITVSSSGLRYHEDYDSSRFYNDIAVVKLSDPVKLNEYICTVKLPSCSDQHMAKSDKNYTVSGWGKTSDRTTSPKLMYAVVLEEPKTSCASFYKTMARYNLIVSQVCTSGSGGKGVCNGDSGGPLVYSDNAGGTLQRGIVSLGLNSCDLGAPSVFTDVNYFMDWLCPQL